MNYTDNHISENFYQNSSTGFLKDIASLLNESVASLSSPVFFE